MKKESSIPGLDRILNIWNSENEASMSKSARHVAMVADNSIDSPEGAIDTIERTLNSIGHTVNELLDLQRGSEADIKVREVLQKAERDEADQKDIEELENILKNSTL